LGEEDNMDKWESLRMLKDNLNKLSKDDLADAITIITQLEERTREKVYIYTNESGLIDDIYDYLFENDGHIGVNFKTEFPESYVDTANARIHLKGKELGNFIIKIERA
jgi:hypothetical protein